MPLRRARHLAFALTLAGVLAAPGSRAADGIPLCSVTQNQHSPASAPDGAGGTYVAWLDQRLGYNTDVYLQRVTATRQRASGWPEGGVAMTLVTCTKSGIALTADSLGALAAWSDNRCSSGLGFDIYALRFTPQGTRAAGWPAHGRLVYSANADQVNTALASDGAGGAFVAWTDLGVFPYRVTAQHLLADGTLDPAWPAGGLVLSSNVPDSCAASLLADGAGGVFVAWQDTRASNGDVWLQRLAASGAPAAGWPVGGSAIITAAGTQYAPRLTADGAGGVFVLWGDRRAGAAQLYAERRDGAGARAAGWSAQGDAIAPGAGEQARARVLADGAGGLYVVWQDHRSGVANVYAQRVGPAAAPVAPWPATGSVVAASAAAQAAPVLASDGAGGMFVSWHDARNFAGSGADVWATRLDSGGAPVAPWPATGTPVCDATGEQRDLRLAAGASGGALAVWTDARATATRGTDIAMALLGPAGSSATQVHALAALHHDGQTFLSWQPPPGLGWKFRVFRSGAPITSSADLAAATLVGTVCDSSAYDRHLSQGLGTPFGYALDSLATPLDPAQGLFVHTVSGSGSAWYAVTSQNSVFGENPAVTPGANALTGPVAELLERPRPVFQRELEINGKLPRFWTLFVPDHDTPLMPAMGNRPGLAWDCAVVQPPAIPFSETTLLVPLHYRGGSVLDGIYGTGYPGEWVLGLDDWLPNGQNTFWYGWADSYDITSTGTPVPLTSGTVVDYTLRRVRFTLDWTLRTFPIDSTRVFAFGYSMGGAGSVLMGTHLGDRFAAVMSVVGKSDYAFASDPDTTCWYNPNGSLRKLANAMWGTLAANLPASEGGTIYEQLDAGWRASQPGVEIAPMYLYAGKLDNTMGWGENPPLREDMNAHGRGAAFYWEMRHHNESFASLWSPTQDPRRLYRYSLDESWPAASNCSFDGDMGDGHATSGDSTGTVNGHIEWDPAGTDSAMHWVRGVSLRSLATMQGQRVPPDSCTADLTLRRVREFRTLPWEPVTFTVYDIAGAGRVAQTGTATADPNGLLTLPAVKIFRLGSLVDVQRHDVTAAGAGGGPRPGIALSRHPARGVVQLGVTWPGTGPARAALYDVQGRQLRVLWNGPTRAATQALTLDTAGLAPGVYLLGAEAGGRRLSRRMVVLR